MYFATPVNWRSVAERPHDKQREMVDTCFMVIAITIIVALLILLKDEGARNNAPPMKHTKVETITDFFDLDPRDKFND